MPGAYASITTSVTSKGKDHEIAEEHTEALGIFLSVVSQVTCDSSGIKRVYFRASLVAQWLGIHLPVQETRVRALVWEDPTCRRATKPVRHNY